MLDNTRARRQDARPGGREAVGVEAAARQPFDILGPAVIVIAGDIAGVVALYPARRVGKNIPDALAAPVGIDRSLDLIARGRGAPDEVGGEYEVLSRGRARAQRQLGAEQAREGSQQIPARHRHHSVSWPAQIRLGTATTPNPLAGLMLPGKEWTASSVPTKDVDVHLRVLRLPRAAGGSAPAALSRVLQYSQVLATTPGIRLMAPASLISPRCNGSGVPSMCARI